VTNIDVDRTTKTFTLKTTVNSSNPKLTSIQSYVYDFGDGTGTKTIKSSSYKNTTSHIYEDGNFDVNVVVNYISGSGSGQTDHTVACSGQIQSDPDLPLGREKTVVNLTQNLDENTAPSTTVKAGDTLEYSLITVNSYDYARNNINTSDYIGDVLEYADLDMAFLSSQGGEYDEETQTISWYDQSVKASTSLANKFRVKIKDPVPSTNQPNVTTTSFDCKISNKYGVQLDIPVDCPLPKTTEIVTTSLPKTGPGSSLVIGFALTSIIGYFFARSRLISKELEIIKNDYAQTGGA